jgi:Calx-beta domain
MRLCGSGVSFGALALLASFFLFFGSPRAAMSQVQGYGVAATGGAGTGKVCTVTTSAESGAGSWDSCISKGGGQTIQFAVPSAKVLFTRSVLSNTTIDGCLNGRAGVTLEQPADTHRSLILEGPVSNVVVRCIRFQGTGKYPGAFIEFDQLALDGTGGPVRTVAIDRCTFTGATDGTVDIVGDVQDVTLQQSLFYNNPLTQLIKYGTRKRISLHHNIYTANAERNPQIKGDAQNIDFVSNAVYNNLALVDPESHTAFSPYGTLLWNANGSSDSPGNVTGNFRSNAWINPNGSLNIDTEAGASAAGIYLSGNYCKPGPCPNSPASSPMAVPAANVVTETTPALMNALMLPTVGAPNRTAADQARIDAVAAVLPQVCAPVTIRQISIGDQTIVEGNTGSKLMAFPVTLSGASTCPVAVSFTTANGTAARGSDYETAGGYLAFPIGTTSQTAYVSILGDKIFESDETFLVNLVSPSGATLGDAQAVGTIQNDDVAGFSVNDVAVVEPASGTTTANFTVTLAPAAAGTTTVDYATANGTAAAGSDYVAQSGTLTFAAGVTTEPVSIVVIGDGLKEAVETFTINLRNPTGGVAVADPLGTGKIYDNGAFFTVPPCRIVDTRGATGPLGGPALNGSSTRPFTLTGSCGIPTGAKAVALNVTVTGATRAGDLRLYAGGAAPPLASTVNFGIGQTRSNNAIVPLSASLGQISVRNNQPSGTVHVIVDVAGYVF